MILNIIYACIIQLVLKHQNIISKLFKTNAWFRFIKILSFLYTNFFKSIFGQEVFFFQE